MARIVRDRDGEGYFGSRVEAIDLETGKYEFVNGPVIGKCLKVGTMTAGMFSKRDWWCTTPVLAILESTDDSVRFKTKNSTYTFYR